MLSEFLNLSSSSSALAADLEKMSGAAHLCGNSRTVLDHLKDLRVEGNIQILTLGQGLVALLDSRLDVFCEGASYDSIANIKDPLNKNKNRYDFQNVWRSKLNVYLSWQHGDITIFRKILSHSLILLGEMKYLVDTKGRVLRSVDVLDGTRLQGLLLLLHDRFHEVNVDCLKGRQVVTDIHGEQTIRVRLRKYAYYLLVYFFLPPVFGGKLLSCDAA